MPAQAILPRPAYSCRPMVIQSPGRSVKMILLALLLPIALIACEPLIINKGAAAKEYLVHKAKALPMIAKRLKPGDTVVLSNGTWTDVQIDFAGKGSKEKPITLRSQTPGLVVLDGNSTLKISGDWLVVDGLRFEGGALEKGSIVEFRGSLGDATNSRFINSSIVDYNPEEIKTRYFWVVLHGQHNSVENNYFNNQNHSGVTVVISRDTPAPNYHTISGNHFTDRPLGDGNGYETIRVGTSHQCESDSFSVIENNLFERIDGELEIISNKSGKNVFRNNTFFKSNGTLTLRHGHGNLVQGNYFLGHGKSGAGGLRIIGRDQTVVNNYFSGLDGWADGAIAITAGQPNSKNNGYPQVKNVVIAHNTIVDVKGAAIAFSQSLGTRDRTLLAEDVTIANNVFFSKQDPLFEGDQSSSWKWEGNVAFGQSLGSAEKNAGIKVVDPKLKPDQGAIMRPQANSPLIDGAVGDYNKIAKVDMDGQERTGPFDIGADEVVADKIPRGPLTGVNVGPALAISLSKDATTATVARNKNSSEALTVTIASSNQSKIKTPATVTIPAGRNSVDFDITATEDQTAGGTQAVTITATAEGHPQGIATWPVEDNLP